MSHNPLLSTLKLVGWGVGGRAGTVALGTANILLLAIYLEPSGYGILLLFVRSVSILTLLGDVGLGQAAMAWFSHRHAGRSLQRRFARAAGAFSVAAAAVAAIGFAVARSLFDQDLPWLWGAAMVASLPACIYANVWSGMQIGLGNMRLLNAVRLTTAASSLVLTVLLVAVGGGGWAAALTAFLLANLVQLGIVVKFPGVGDPPETAARPALAELVGFGLRAHANAVLYACWTSVPLYILAAGHGTAAAAVFGLACQVVDKLLLPGQAVYEATFRRLASLPPEAGAARAAGHAAVTAAGTAIVAGLSFPLLLWGAPWALGDAYARLAAVALPLLLAAPFANALLLLDPFFVNTLRRPGVASILTAANLGLALALGTLLVPRLGAIGAAISLGLSQAIGLAMALVAIKKLSDREWSHIWAAACAALTSR